MPHLLLVNANSKYSLDRIEFTDKISEPLLQNYVSLAVESQKSKTHPAVQTIRFFVTYEWCALKYGPSVPPQYASVMPFIS